jgi:hypothetical protein
VQSRIGVQDTACRTKMLLMLSFDQIQLELKAILDFDLLFLAASKHHPEEIVGFKFRQLRRQELLGLADSLVSRN